MDTRTSGNKNLKLKICHLYPDVLNLNGDAGNVACMQKRLEWRGIECEVKEVCLGERFEPSDYDIFFMGGGEDFEHEILVEDALEYKRDSIISLIEAEKVMLAVGGGFDVLGMYYKTISGKKIEMIDCFEFYTVETKNRLTGNIMFECNDLKSEKVSEGDEIIIGFENHAGKTYLGEGLKSFGKVIKGHGNNGEDGKEGLVYNNLYCTHCHGPILPNNPEFCDMLLRRALWKKYGIVELDRLNDKYERNARAVMKKRLSEQK